MIYRIQDELRFGADISLMEELPLGNWLLMFDEPRNEFYLKKQPDFDDLPKKLYGDDEKVAKIYLKTFESLKKNMGVLLTGQKGGGKSTMAKLICNLSNQPTILITQPFVGDLFKSFLSSITQHVNVFVDEFEKVYPDEEKKQEEFLTILDGVFQSKKLFIFTANSMSINQFLKNRPGRIRYLRKYGGLEKAVIKEIIADLLENSKHENDLISLTNLLSSVSMDVLLTLIQEVNLYDITPLEAVRMLNIQVEHNEFDVLMFLNGKRHITKINYNPLISKYIYIAYKEVRDNGEDRWRYYEREKDEFDIQSGDGEFRFKDREGNEIIFTPSKSFEFSL